MTDRSRASEILKRLKKIYTTIGPFVEWSTPLELLIGTVLSAQCTDVRVNEVTKKIFKKYKTARDYAEVRLSKLEKEIYTTGFYKSKAKYLKGIGEMLIEKHKGKVPDSLEELLELPGVSHKTAYLVLAKAFKKNIGIAVDTHVKRVAPRLGLTKEKKNADKIGKDLEKLVLSKKYLDVNEYFILHGRATCKPGRPLCNLCVLQDICPTAEDIWYNK